MQIEVRGVATILVSVAVGVGLGMGLQTFIAKKKVAKED